MKILLGMSGGVDSTYAALRLIREGHTVEGAVLVMHDYTAVDEAVESAKALGIPIRVIDCKKQFEECVVSDFLREYRAGRTPNPCTVCNRTVKFAALLQCAKENGFDAIATGHYGRVEATAEGRYSVRRSGDLKKDQSYMLWRLSQEELSKLILPLSDIEKSDVRKESAEAGLVAADRSDSQEICFIPSGDYASYIEERTGKSEKGDFVDENGKKLGEHLGIVHYTVGQRKGLGISAPSRIFVTKIDPETNRITLSPNDSFATKVTVKDLNFLALPEQKNGSEMSVFVKLRYAAPPVKATASFDGEGGAKLVTETPVRAVTPGQSAVCYDSDGLLLFGGVIDSAE